MSNAATHWAWHLARRLNAAEEDGIEPGALLVLLAMCDCADEHEITYPSRATVASWTGQSERTVRRHVLALEERELIIRLDERRRRQTGVFAPDAWTLNIAGNATPPQAGEVEEIIARKAEARRAKQRRQPPDKMTAGPADKMTAGPADKNDRTSGQNGQASIDEPFKVKPVRKQKGEGASAPEGAPSPGWNTLAGRLARLVERERRIDPNRCRSWFEPLQAEGEDRLTAPTRFFVNYVSQQFATELRLGGIDLDVVELAVRTDSAEGAKRSTG